MSHNLLPFKLDIKLLLPVIVLLFLSLTTIFTVNVGFFRNQLLFVLVSLFVFVGFSQINYKSLQFYAVPIYIASFLLLLLVLFIGIESRGAARWLVFFGFGVQFSELIKPFLALALASFLAHRNSTSGATLVTVLALVLPIAFLIYRQPDLGNALIYIGTVMLTLIFYGFPLRWFAFSIAAVGGSIPLIWRFLHEYQRERLMTFFHLTNDPLGVSYNAIQSVISVGSGMFFGKGLGEGTQSNLRFLPERHTDFIFATLSEELGFIGCLILLIAFCFLLYRFYEIFMRTDDIFCKVFIASAFSLIFIQFFVNIGMNIGMLPIVGVTLPFVSYGGSSLLSNAIFLGIVSAMGSYSNRKNVLEIT